VCFGHFGSFSGFAMPCSLQGIISSLLTLPEFLADRLYSQPNGYAASACSLDFLTLGIACRTLPRGT
jgi:hypothetical protein